MSEKTVQVPAISCMHCVKSIQREIAEIDGVERVDASAENKQVTVAWAAPASWEQIAGTLAEIGYAAAD